MAGLKRYWFPLSLFVIASITAYIVPIGTSSEAREVHIARTIYEYQTWLLPTRNGVIPSKPLLYHWCAASIATVLGTFNELIARLPSIFFGALLVFLTMRQARRVSNSDHVAHMAGFILATTYGFLVLSVDAQVDMTFSFFVTAAVYSVLNREKPSERQFLLFYLCCGLAVLAKGPLGLGLPVLIGGICTLVREQSFWRTASLWLRPRVGWMLFLGLVLPWYLYANFQQAGFYERQLIFENLERLVGGKHTNTQSWWFYGPSFLRTTFPWGIFFILLLIRQVRRGFKDEQSRIMALPAIGVLCGLLLFSVASGKRHSYLLPLFPLLAVYIATAGADWSHRIFSQKPKRILIFLPAFGAFFFFILSRVQLTEYLSLTDENVRVALAWSNWGAFYIGIFLVLSFLVAHITQKRSLNIGFMIAIVASYYAIVGYAEGLKNSLKGYSYMADRIVALVPPEAPLSVVKEPYDELFDGIMYYLHRPVSIVREVSPQMNGYYLLHAKSGNLNDCKTLLVQRQPSDELKKSKDRDVMLCAKGL